MMHHPWAKLSVSELMAIAGGELDNTQIAQKMGPAGLHGDNEPDDELLKFMAGLARTRQGEALFQFIWKLTFLAPYPVTVENMEALAFAGAKHQARCAVGEVILAAITTGDRLIEEQKEAKNEQSH